MLPFMMKGLKSTARMRELQPKMKEIQDRYKDDPQEMQKRMMAFYKENNFNPLGGCLPMLVQMPVMIGLFSVLREFPTRLAENPQLQEAAINIQFLGIDLTQTSRVLAVVAGLTTLLSMMAAPGDPSQKKMLAPLALVTLFVGFSLPSGVVLYIVITNLFTWLQHFLVRGDAPPPAAPAKS